MVYISMEKEFVDKNLEKWNKEAMEEMGEEGKNVYLYMDDVQGEIEEISENNITISCDSKLGYITTEIKLDTEDFLHLLEIAIEKFKKLKDVFEKLK